MYTVMTIVVVLVFFCVGVHFDSKALGQTRKQRREMEQVRERNRLFWSIREKEMDIYGRWLS